jgi:transposase
MNMDLSSLGDDRNISKKDVLLFLQNQQEKYQLRIDYLEEQLRLLRNELFGRKSEKPPRQDQDQIPLFGEPEQQKEADLPEQKEKTVDVPAHRRKKGGRKPLPENLPRVDVVHDISDEEKMCACGHMMSRIGHDECEKLDYIPAKIQVIRHIRPKYACKHCEGVESDGPTVKIAPPAIQLIPKSIATEGLLAHIFTSKFADGLPLYRQQKIFARHGLELSRSTMAGWAIEASNRCRPLMELLAAEIRGGPVINVDETTLQVLKEPGRRNTSKSYMWLYRGGLPEKPVLVYQYASIRSGQVAQDFIGDFEGYLQADAFSGYDRFEKNSKIRLMGCWAHARRKFFDVVKAKKKIRSKSKNPKSLADEALSFIKELYKIEKQAREKEMDRSEIYQLRQEQAVDVLDNFEQWLDEKSPIVPPKSLLGKAIAYARNNWSRLTVYVEDGLLKPDNNAAENAIRPFVVGRKNWLFAGHPRGADANATFFSLIETAKANNLEPYSYLRYIFEQLPQTNESDYTKLLPINIDRKVPGIASLK